MASKKPRKSRAKKASYSVSKVQFRHSKQRAKSAAQKHQESVPGAVKSVGAEVHVQKTGQTGAKAFEACVVVGKGAPVCDKGTKPAQAMAKAFRKTAKRVSNPSAALSGFKFLRRMKKR